MMLWQLMDKICRYIYNFLISLQILSIDDHSKIDFILYSYSEFFFNSLNLLIYRDNDNFENKR